MVKMVIFDKILYLDLKKKELQDMQNHWIYMKDL